MRIVEFPFSASLKFPDNSDGIFVNSQVLDQHLWRFFSPVNESPKEELDVLLPVIGGW